MSITIEDLKLDLRKIQTGQSAYTDRVKDFLAVHEQTLAVIKEPLNGEQLIALCQFYGAPAKDIKKLKMRRVSSPSMYNNDLLYINVSTRFVPGVGSTVDIFYEAQNIVNQLNAFIRQYLKLSYAELDKNPTEENILKAMYLRRDTERFENLLRSTSGYDQYQQEIIQWSEMSHSDNYIDTDYNLDFLESAVEDSWITNKENCCQLTSIKTSVAAYLFFIRARMEFISRIESFGILSVTN